MIKNAEASKMLRVILLGTLTIILSGFLLLSASTSVAYGLGGVVVNPGDEGFGGEVENPTGIEHGETERQSPSTGGSSSGSSRDSCGGRYLLYGPGSNYLGQDCWRTGHTYEAIPSDDRLRYIRQGNGGRFASAALISCAPVDSSGATGREQNGRTLVAVSVQYEYMYERRFWEVSWTEEHGDQYYLRGLSRFDPNAVGTVRNVNVNCIYQEWEDVSVNRLCVVAIDIYINKNDGIGNIGRIDHSRATSPWGAGNSTLAACERSNHLQSSISRRLVEPGRYDTDTVVFFQPITVRTYSGAPAGHTRPADEIVSIGQVTSRPGPKIYAQVTCDPAHTSAGTVRSQVYTGGPWSWTHADCDPTTPNSPGAAAYQCTNVDTATLNGRSGLTSAQVFRDAEDNVLSWNNPSIAGSRVVSVVPRDTRVVRSGTPWNTPRNMPVGNNNVTLHTASGTNVLARNGGWINGQHNSFNFTANWASNAGAPTVLRPTWRYDATLNTRVPVINSITARFTGNSGSWTITPNIGSVNVPMTAVATCNSQFEIDVVRAVNDVT